MYPSIILTQLCGGGLRQQNYRINDSLILQNLLLMYGELQPARELDRT